MSICDNFLAKEIEFLLKIQNICHPFENVLEFVTKWASPACINRYWIPIIGAFDLELMIQLVCVTGTVNVLTDLLKLVSQASRPFWWIRETTKYTERTLPPLYQTDVTCETSSGFPSGYSSLFTAVLVVLRNNILAKLRRKNTDASHKLKFLIDLILSGLLILMWITRIYFSSHFLHQCIFGSLLGMTVASYILYHIKEVKNIKKINAVAFVLICGSILAIIYIIMKMYDCDPQHSIRMAFKWCPSVFYLSPDSTVISCMFADMGTLLGFAIASPHSSRSGKKLNLWKSIPTSMFLIWGKHYLLDQTPRRSGTSGRIIFLACRLGINCIYSFLLTWGVIKISHVKQ